MKTKRPSPFTYHVSRDKEKRNLSMLDMIRRKGILSRTDISRSTGINVVSVSNYINHFIDKKLVEEKGHAVSSGGRKPELVELNSKENHVLGIDASSGMLTAVVADIGLKVVEKRSCTAPAHRRDIAAAIRALAGDVIKASGIEPENLRAAGLCVSDEDIMAARVNTGELFDAPTFIGGAACCGAFAEKNFNASVDTAKLLYSHSDLGSGVFIDTDTFIGCASHGFDGKDSASEATAEIAGGFADLVKYTRPWSAQFGTVGSARREVARGVGTKIVSLLEGRGIESITEDIVIAAARQKDETASKILESVAINLGLRIAYLINLFDPEVVVIGGGPEKAQDIMFPLIRKMITKLSHKKYVDSIKILSGTLGEDGLCMGAAALAAREVFLNA